MLCPACIAGAAQGQTEWYTYRHDSARTGAQPFASDLSDPDKVKGLQVQRKFPMDGDAQHPERGFYASPIIVNDTVFIGSINGYFYALDGETLALKWQFPKVGDRPLLGSCDIDGPTQSVGKYGISSSAIYAQINGQDAVIFGASDPDAEGGLGSAALFALDFSGHPIWKRTQTIRIRKATLSPT